MAFKGTPGLIGQAFSSAFRQEKQMTENKRQFDLGLAERQKQNNLLNFWKEQNFEREKAYQEGVIKNKAEDLRLQGITDKADIANLIRDDKRASRKLESDIYSKQQKGLLDKAKFDKKGEFKGFGDYIKNRAELLSSFHPATSKYSASPKSESEMQLGISKARDLALSQLPKNARSFYNDTFGGRKISEYGFLKTLQNARNEGKISEQDAEALALFNDIRSDFGEIPEKITRLTR